VRLINAEEGVWGLYRGLLCRATIIIHGAARSSYCANEFEES
jgi:hypothetical protein